LAVPFFAPLFLELATACEAAGFFFDLDVCPAISPGIARKTIKAHNTRRRANLLPSAPLCNFTSVILQ